MAKQNLLGDTVIRRDGRGMLWLMNHQEGGWRSDLFPVESEEWLLATYNVKLGEWSRDECSEYCPVIRLGREEMPTLHDGDEPPMTDAEIAEHIEAGFRAYPLTRKAHDRVSKEEFLARIRMQAPTYEQIREMASEEKPPFVLDDIGPRGQVPVGDPSEVEAFQLIREYYGQPGPNMVDDRMNPVVVGDGITPKSVRELARGRAGYSSTLGFGSLCHETIHQVLGENPELKLHDFGPRGPSALGVDGKPVEKKP